MAMTIDGPLGPFEVPESSNPRTREVCEQLSRQVFGEPPEWAGEYDHPELPSVLSTGPDLRQPVVIDVGASWGPFVVWAAKQWGGGPEGLTILAYEPNEKSSSVLEENVAPVRRRGVAVYVNRAAVTSDPDPRLNGCEDFGAYTLEKGECAWSVAGVHPRDLPPCCVLKVDCEGSEVDVLENYPHLAGCDALLVEFHDLEKKRRVREIAEAAGFRCVREEPEPATFGVCLWVRAA